MPRKLRYLFDIATIELIAELIYNTYTDNHILPLALRVPIHLIGLINAGYREYDLAKYLLGKYGKVPVVSGALKKYVDFKEGRFFFEETEENEIE